MTLKWKGLLMRFIHVLLSTCDSLLCIIEYNPILRLRPMFTIPLFDGHLGYFQNLAIMNKTAEHIFFIFSK